jgi:hypothetical protein
MLLLLLLLPLLPLLLLLLLRLLRLRWLLLRPHLLRLPLCAPAVAVAPSALPASDVLLPTAGAVHARCRHLFYSRCRLATTGWTGGKATGETDTAETTKETKSWKDKSDDSTDAIGKKRQRGGSKATETQMATN